MLSRRSFLLGHLAGLVSIMPGFYWPQAALARKAKPEVLKAGPHALARQDWPPAIVPDHIGMADKGFCCFADEFGRLAVVDLRKPGNPKTPPRVVAELSGLGKKVIDFKVELNKAFALVSRQTESGDSQLALIMVNLAPITDPSLASQLVLDRYSEVFCLAVSLDLVCVAGTSLSGENLISLFSIASRAKGRPADPTFVGSVSTELPVSAMDLQDRNLLILESGNTSQLEYFGLVDPRSPVTRATVKIEGEFRVLSRFRDTALVAGSANGRSVAKSIALEPQPHVVSELPLDPISTVFDAAAQSGRFLIYGDASGDRMLASILYDKGKNLIKEQVVPLAKESGAYGSHSSVVLNGRNAYVASGWAGVQMLTLNGSTWAPNYTYTIPRLPASSMASWGDLVVLAGADLKLYDIQQPTKPALVTTANMTSSVKSVVGAGSFVICLTKDSILLRKMDKLNENIASVKIIGQQLCFDKAQQRAFVLKESINKKNVSTTTVSKFQVYSNSLISEKVYDVPGSFARASANGGYLVIGGVNDVSLYKVGDTAEQIGTRHFENLAVRDVILLDDYIVVTAIDQSSKGFLLILSKGEKDLHVIGSVDLPHDGVALAAAKNSAVAIGRTPDGKDLATIINFSTPSTPQVVANLPTVEAASAIAIKDQMAIVAGRGLELLSLS